MKKWTAKWVARGLLSAVFPFVVVWAVLARVWNEVASIPRYVACDVAEEWDEAKRIWRDAERQLFN